MIVYFTGTGNSRYCARLLADKLGDDCTSAFHYIRDGIALELTSEKPWVFVTPTYSWQIPHVFLELIRGGRFTGCREAYFVMTCGEDIGNADPQAILVAEAAFKAAEVIGYPECRINLAQAAIYNALAPKSNACEAAIDAALADVHTSGQREIPNHLRDRHRPGSDEYGPYLYPHDYPEGWVEQRYLPEGLERGAFWKPAGRGWEEWRVEQSARDRSGRAPETSA